MSDSLPGAPNAEGRADVGGLSLPTADAHPRAQRASPGPVAHRRVPPEHPPRGPGEGGEGRPGPWEQRRRLRVPGGRRNRPGQGKESVVASRGRSVRCPSQLPRRGRAGVPPGRALSATAAGSQPEPQSIRRGGLGRVLRRSDSSEDGGEARPGAPPGAGGARWAAALGQGTPPAAVALGADLVGGGGIVPVVDGRPVELVDQPMHRARPEAARLCLEVGESVSALAVALDADVSILPVAAGRERAGMRKARWGPGGGDAVGEGRGGQGAPGLETGWSRRCPPAAPAVPHPERAAHAKRGPAALRLFSSLCTQGSSYYLYLSFAAKALLSPAR